MGVRELLSLVKWLPNDAAVWKKNKSSWSNMEELQAQTVEMLDIIFISYLGANTKKGFQLPKPIHIPRPWELQKDDKERNSGTTIGELVNSIKVPIKVDKGEVS